MKSAIILSALAITAYGMPAEKAALIPVPVVANFDDIPNVTPFVGFPPPTPYKFLNYTGFGLGAPLANAVTLQPSSRPNAAYTPFIPQTPLASAVVSRDYPGSNVISFDLNSVNAGCYIGGQNGVFAPAADCTIRFRGTSAVTGIQVFQDFDFKTGSFFGIAQRPVAAQKVIFGPLFKGLRSVSITVIKASFPAPPFGVQLGADDFQYTVFTAP